MGLSRLRGTVLLFLFILRISRKNDIERLVDGIGNVLSVFLPLFYAFCQQILDLTVDGTEIILCPRGNGVVKLRGESQRDLFFLTVGHGKSQTLSVKASGVDYGLSVLVSAEDNEEIRHHSRLSLFVKFHGTILVKAFKSHFDHADGALDDHLPGVNNG